MPSSFAVPLRSPASEQRNVRGGRQIPSTRSVSTPATRCQAGRARRAAHGARPSFPGLGSRAIPGSDRTRCQTAPVSALREEVGRLTSYGERHRRLLARLTLIVIATVVLDLLAAGTMYLLERHAKGTEIKTLGQAVFFTTVQLLTVSSQIKNPLTPAGRIIDIGLELWAVVVVAGSAGAVATFFQSSDSA
jgi:hypothetical protein